MGRSVATFVIAASLAVVFRPSGLAQGAEGPAAKTRKPLCWVQITPKDGLPSEAYLLAFEDGTFLLRHRNKQEYTLDEKDVESIRFMPARPGKPEKRPKVEPDTESRRDDDRAKPGPRRPMLDARGRWDDKLRKLEPRMQELKRSGKLAGHIEKHEQRLRESKDVYAARQLLFELSAAHRVNGRVQDRDYWRRLIESIKDQRVRRSPMLRGFPAFGSGRRHGRQPVGP